MLIKYLQYGYYIVGIPCILMVTFRENALLENTVLIITTTEIAVYSVFILQKL